MTVAVVLLSLTMFVAFGWAAVGGVMCLAKVRGGAGPRPSLGGHRATVPCERPAQPRTLCGGVQIGALERLTITCAILARQSEMVAVVAVVKGLSRWVNLQANLASTERSIIDALASCVAAGVYGYVGLALVSQPQSASSTPIGQPTHSASIGSLCVSHRQSSLCVPRRQAAVFSTNLGQLLSQTFFTENRGISALRTRGFRHRCGVKIVTVDVNLIGGP